MRSLKIFTALFFLIITTTIAQEKEYIVTNRNDTIYGKITRAINYLNTSEIRYKIKDEKGNNDLINPSEVKIIRSIDGVDGDCFIATIYDKWFLKRIINGRIKVYQLVDGVLFFTSKDDSEIKSTDFGGLNARENGLNRIRPLIEDNPIILEEFNSMKGSQKNILYIIEKYNDYAKLIIATMHIRNFSDLSNTVLLTSIKNNKAVNPDGSGCVTRLGYLRLPRQLTVFWKKYE
ncbi:hypothetical protein [Gillisia sp. JM1]|uniref:hypothetical protein n=1 Tax=Gillisia sp. JM1 TaxID=1283286 RepID=UPI00041296F1|nr:hypothetical protein [Gillisia sp. JM1]